MKNSNNLYVSSSCLKKTYSFEKHINLFLKNNIMNVELSGIHEYTSLKLLENKIKFFQKKKMKFTFHNYFPAPKKEIILNLISRKKNNFISSQKLIDNALHLANRTGIKIYAFHPGYLKEGYIKNKKFFFSREKLQNYETSYKVFQDRLSKIIIKNKDNLKNVNLGLENLFPLPKNKKISLMNNFFEINKIFSNNFLKKNKIKLLLDLGHLEIASNLLKFDKDTELNKILKKYSKIINEVHISANDLKNDLHLRISESPWQLETLPKLKKKLSKNTIFTMESRNLTMREIKTDHALLLDLLK